MNNDDGINKVEFIPDFFRELISRIIPGLVVIAICLYWSQCNLRSDFKDVFSDATISVFALMAGWVIGVTLDVGVFLVSIIAIRIISLIMQPTAEEFLEECKKHIKGFTFCIGLGEELPVKKFSLGEYEYLCQANPWERGYLIKCSAQVIFFRSMGSICALIVLFCKFSDSCSTANLLPRLNGYNCLLCSWTLLFGIVFWFCWYLNLKSQKVFLKQLTEKQLSLPIKPNEVGQFKDLTERPNPDPGELFVLYVKPIEITLKLAAERLARELTYDENKAERNTALSMVYSKKAAEIENFKRKELGYKWPNELPNSTSPPVRRSYPILVAVICYFVMFTTVYFLDLAFHSNLPTQVIIRIAFYANVVCGGLITICSSFVVWRSNRWVATLGFVACLFWIVWILLLLDLST